MTRKRIDLGQSPRAWAPPTSEPKADDDPWTGEDAWLDETARQWLREDAAENEKLASLAWAVLVCSIVGAAVWALIGYGVYRLVAG
jgi:hypothetical protein